ncbi:MAG: hypothetical protein CVU81_01905, partial [Euryarchaeota archaeon HGW-Euryarchaeota-1]
HIGSWGSVPKLQELAILSLEKVCDAAVLQKVDFVVAAGDLFDTSFVGFDLLGRAIGALMKLKKAKIPIYLIYGSHDVSALGESMIDLLEKAEIVVNVGKNKNSENTDDSNVFVVDAKTQANIIGVGGKRRGLDKFSFNNNLEPAKGYSIFVFHNLVSEILGQEFPFIEGMTLDQLPRKFDYYAAGHIHARKIVDFSDRGYGMIVYPGPLFPANVDEIRKLGQGSYAVVDNSNNKPELCEIKLKDVFEIKVEVESEIEPQIIASAKGIKDKIVILTLKGKSNGKKLEINEYKQSLESFEPYCVVINNKIADSDEIMVDYQQSGERVEEIERRALEEIAKNEIHQQLCRCFGFNQTEILSALLNGLNIEKQDGETNIAFEDRVINTSKKIIKERTNNEEEGELNVSTNPQQKLN